MEKKHRITDIEIWGGIECTINRIGETYIDQLSYSGHYNRNKDIDLFAELGIKTLRYPVLWEYHAPKKDLIVDWSKTEKNLAKIKELNISPIAGLVHHGSGPNYTNLLSSSFAEGLENYAYEVAKKNPWIEFYTPVNEPLTTARFCGLYGLWHPHEKSGLSFARILLNECKAIVMAMKAIRKVNPSAKLIQTEDLGKTYSTPLLKYQADFENERRWLTFDLLCGKLNSTCRMWDYLIWLGIDEKDLFFFLDNPCIPDIIGINHYVTSERFLDEKLENYPIATHGGNNKHKYADVEALRVDLINESGAYNLVKEVWERYQLPISITEVHLSCTREEQMRWLIEIWEIAENLKKEKVDIRAITPWALLGSFGWNKLLTTEQGEYESGVFDVRSSPPRPTALAKLIKSLAHTGSYDHPVLEEKGWWKNENRFLYCLKTPVPDTQKKIENKNKSSKPVLIIGKNGTLGNAFARICESRRINYIGLGRMEMDICNLSEIERIVKECAPWAIINAAGFVRVDEAETQLKKCFLDNAEGPANLAVICKKYNIKLLTFSSDLVFDGEKQSPYIESDPVSPLNIYGQSKAKADKNVLEHNPSALIIRTSAFFGPWDEFNFVTQTLHSLLNKKYSFAANDVFVSPTYIPDLVNCSLDLLIDDEKGIWHLANSGAVTWAELASEVAGRINYNTKLIHPIPLSDLNLRAPRPYYSVLTSEKGIMLPSLENGLNNYFKEQEIIKF